MNLHFPVFELPAEAEAPRREVREFVAEEERAGLWQRGGESRCAERLGDAALEAQGVWRAVTALMKFGDCHD